MEWNCNIIRNLLVSYFGKKAIKLDIEIIDSNSFSIDSHMGFKYTIKQDQHGITIKTDIILPPKEYANYYSSLDPCRNMFELANFIFILEADFHRTKIFDQLKILMDDIK